MRPFAQSFFVLHSSFFVLRSSFFVLRFACAPLATCVSVAFPEYFCTITVLSLYGEYVACFPLPHGVFLPRDHGLDFFNASLCENSIKSN